MGNCNETIHKKTTSIDLKIKNLYVIKPKWPIFFFLTSHDSDQILITKIKSLSNWAFGQNDKFYSKR